MGNIIDVKALVEQNKKTLKLRVEALKQKGVIPKMVVVLANNNSDSLLYVSRKEKLCQELGIVSETIVLGEETTNEELLNVIDKLNKDKTVFGILVQMPLFKHLDENACVLKISPEKDVDGLTPENIGKLVIGGMPAVIPCTAKGVMKILDYANVSVEGKKVVVFGRSILVGKPVYTLMLNKNAQVQICHTKTPNAMEISKEADIVVVAIGKPKKITRKYIKEGATVIDVGINRTEDGKVVGDVDLEDVIDIVENITKVPGGVGLTTVMCLCENLIELMEKQ